MKYLHLLVLGWVLATTGQAAEKIDLTYPPAGTRALIIDASRGEWNMGVLLTEEARRARGLLYERGHVVINPDFSVSILTPSMPGRAPTPDRIPAARPAAKTSGDVVRLSAVPATSVQPAQSGLLWRVEEQGATAGYVFGTAHVEDSRVLNLPAPVKNAFDNSPSFAMEVLLDQADPGDMNAAMLFMDGRSLDQVAGKELSEKSTELMADRGIPKRLVMLMKPWAVAMILGTPKPKTGIFLDMSLYRQAKKQGKRVYGLETMEEQFATLDSTPMEEQIYLLKETVENQSLMPAMFEEMVERYLARDLAGLVALADKYKSGNQRIADAFMKRLVDNRNTRMVERMLPRLNEGGVFIAIGVLHLPGENGVLEMLKKRGYRVTAVY